MRCSSVAPSKSAGTVSLLLMRMDYRRLVLGANDYVEDYFPGSITFGAAVNGSIPNFGYASLG